MGIARIVITWIAVVLTLISVTCASAPPAPPEIERVVISAGWPDSTPFCMQLQFYTDCSWTVGDVRAILRSHRIAE